MTLAITDRPRNGTFSANNPFHVAEKAVAAWRSLLRKLLLVRPPRAADTDGSAHGRNRPSGQTSSNSSTNGTVTTIGLAISPNANHTSAMAYQGHELAST